MSDHASRRFDAAIFDLDGTLLDTIGDLASSMNHALASLNRPTHDSIEPFKYFVGDGTRTFAKRALGADYEDLADEVVRRLGEYYQTNYNKTTKPYPGITGMLDALTLRGVRLAVLSNKIDRFTRQMIAEMLPSAPFEAVRGARDDTPLKPDPAAALLIAHQMGIEPARVAYVGDTSTDMLTGSRAGMFTVGALWGYRTRQELIDHGADALIAAPGDLVALAGGA